MKKIKYIDWEDIREKTLKAVLGFIMGFSLIYLLFWCLKALGVL